MKNKFMVYPGHGVGRVLGIEKKHILGADHDFISLEILQTGMKIVVPKKGAKAVGLRNVMDKTTAKKVISALNVGRVKARLGVGTGGDDQTWNKTYRIFMEQIKSGDPIQIAEVLGILSAKKMRQELSFGERKMLDNAEALLFTELRVSLDLSPDQELPCA
jgi:CarD family transcriptional regulator